MSQIIARPEQRDAERHPALSYSRDEDCVGSLNPVANQLVTTRRG